MAGQTQYGDTSYGVSPDVTLGIIKKNKQKPLGAPPKQAKLKGQRKGYNV